MKKVILFTAVTAVCFSTFISCKKEAKPQAPVPVTYPVQPGVVAQLSSTLTFQSLSDGTNYEMGISFKASVKGSIKSLKLRLPAAGSKLVTLWKAGDHSIVES